MESRQTGRTATPPHPTELKQNQRRLLNVKKGWMTKLDEDGTWKKHWFVLTDQSLRYYKDSLAEEASDADGEIDLSTCSDVQEFPVQRNYGFRILCRGGVRTLSAMTSGIRRNWIQAIAENARAAVAPDDARKNISLKLSVLKPRSVPEMNPEGRAPPEPRQGVRPEPSPRPEPPDAVCRSKTSDRSRFQIDQMGETAKERADAVRSGPSLSATASRRSSPSSSSPSPVPASAPPTPRVSGPRPASPIEDDVSRPPNVLLPKSPAQPSLPESPQRGRMRVDRPAALRDVEGETCGVASSAREEIERRWLGVETTPLREEKQVAIGASSENSHADGLPAQRLAALLRKELGQKQKVLEQLQRQNSVFQEQLEDALGREQSARHGYVLQSATAPSSSPRRVPPQHSHKLNRDSRSALESPQREQVLARRQIQMLEKNPTEAQTATDRREANVEAPRSRPASASAEISASERAVARVRDELESERDRSKEQEEERGRTEATLRAQRKDGESRLREVEASLWERSRALRHPEHQRALRRDHAREIQRLRGRLREVTARLLATEEGRTLMEQRLRKERRGLRESHERERQSLRRRIAEAEAGLLEAKRQLEALLGGWRGSAGRERGERSPKPRREPTPTSDAFESPRESVRRLEEEKGLLARRCQQLLEQTAEADREVGKLRARLETQRADYCTLENSYERATRESWRMSRSLREKEEEILQTEAVYRSLLESKEEDLKEALVKMSALGNDLEETERKLQAKEDLLSLTGRRVSDRVEADAARQNLKAELAAAEKRVAELRRHLGALRPGCADPGWSQPGRNWEGDQTFTSDGESPLSFGAASRTEDSADDDESRAKQTAVPFSDARLHARHHPGDRRSFDHARNQRDFDLAQALTRAERAGDSDELMSIVRAPETKPLATEEKLKSLTRTRTNEPGGCESVPGIAAGTAAHAEALLCVETSRQKVEEAFLSGSRDRAGSPLRPLSEVRRELSRASAHIRRGQKTSEEQSPRRPATKTAELSQQEAVPLFAQTLSFEALVLDEMALLVRTSESDLLQTLTAIREDVENIQSGDDDCLAVVYADVLTRKLMSETTVRREEPEREAKPRGGVSNEANARAEAGVNASAVFHALVKAELSYSVRNLKLDYQEKLRLLEGELAEAHRELAQRERALKAIIEASERADWKSAIREAEADFGFGPASPAVVCPPELAPYAERIRLQEARDLAEKVVERRLADEMPPGDPAEPLQSACESLAVELQQQAAKLRKYAEEIRSSRSHPELAQTLCAALGPRASRPFTSASLCMREALVQSQVAYVACRLRAAHKRNSARCQETRRSADAPARRRAGCGGAVREKCETSLPGEHFHMQVEEPEHREESRDATRPAPSEGATDSRQRPKEDPPADANAAKERHRNRVKKLKDDFERQIAQLRRIRRDEAVGSHPAPGQSIAELRLNGSHRRVASSPTEAGERQTVSEGDAAGLLKDRIRQLEAQMNALRDQLENERLEGDVAGLRVKYQRDSESLKATCERGFAAMEETHHKVVEDLQRRHQREISKLTEERERLLAEETAATVAAIEAMKNAHEEELEKNRRSQLSGLDADIDQLRLQYREELRSVQRELEVLSEQYSQKCLENAHLAQALEAERQALGQCQRENRELEAHNQELNGRLSAEIARMRSCLSGETALSPVTPGKDVYELEVLLRVKESEIQYLKREIHSLKDELQSALRDKKYATDKHKDIYAELSVSKAKADCDIGKLKEKLHIATQALGDGTVWSGYDILKSKSNPDFTKKEQTTTSEPSASVRSKSLKEGLTVQERTKMFQAKESEKI